MYWDVGVSVTKATMRWSWSADLTSFRVVNVSGLCVGRMRELMYWRAVVPISSP
jgi:hypothetical protein